MAKIQVVAKLKIQQEHLKEVYEVLKELHRLTHLNDKGCIQYDLHKDLDDESLFIFIEEWENSDYLIKHEQSTHFKDAISKIENKIEDVQINKMEQLNL